MTFFTKVVIPDKEVRLKESLINLLSFNPSLRCNAIVKPVIIVIMPSPPICIKSKITICPKILQVVTVGKVTNPVTQVEVVAVNNASIYGTGFPVFELIGKASKMLPINITNRKLSIMTWVVESFNLYFFMIDFLKNGIYFFYYNTIQEIFQVFIRKNF